MIKKKKTASEIIYLWACDKTILEPEYQHKGNKTNETRKFSAKSCDFLGSNRFRKEKYSTTTQKRTNKNFTVMSSLGQEPTCTFKKIDQQYWSFFNSKTTIAYRLIQRAQANSADPVFSMFDNFFSFFFFFSLKLNQRICLHWAHQSSKTKFSFSQILIISRSISFE